MVGSDFSIRPALNNAFYYKNILEIIFAIKCI